MINSTIGIGGLFDVAKELEFVQEPTDFAKTLQAWCLPSGLYLILPVLGSSSVRDLIAKWAQFTLLDHFNVVARSYNLDSLSYVREAVELAEETFYYGDTFRGVKETSFDIYTSLRRLYYQKRGDRGSIATYQLCPPSSVLDKP